MPEARRTIVKSPPELWTEISDPGSLGRHLEAFGEIRITRLEPETTVAWEGDRARGTVELAGSGWGTKVRLTAEPVAAEEEAEPALQQPLAAEGEPEEEPPAGEDPRAGEEAAPEEPRKRRGFFARIFRRREETPVVEEPVIVVEEPVAEEPVLEEPVAQEPAVEVPSAITLSRLPDDEAAAVLDRALDTLGAAHHRPFSR
jgi:hypothetical protein